MPFIIYFDLQHAIEIHDKIIEISGGALGIRDKGLLESVLEHVKNDNYYPDLPSKLTHIIFSVAMNHAFSDGNKRSAIALGGLFLTINGYGRRVGIFIIEMENIILWVAEHRIDKIFLFEIVGSILEHREFTEEIKLKLLSVIGGLPI